jgi:hypothetical protein
MALVADTDLGQAFALAAASKPARIPAAAAADPASRAPPRGVSIAATFRTQQGGRQGRRMARPLTADSGTFTFFDPDNVEVLVKVLNACGLNNRYWVFSAGLTNVRVKLTVTDTKNGAAKNYANPPEQGLPADPGHHGLRHLPLVTAGVSRSVDAGVVFAGPLNAQPTGSLTATSCGPRRTRRKA